VSQPTAHVEAAKADRLAAFAKELRGQGRFEQRPVDV
jgi:hypothetical protein